MWQLFVFMEQLLKRPLTKKDYEDTERQRTKTKNCFY